MKTFVTVATIVFASAVVTVVVHALGSGRAPESIFMSSVIALLVWELFRRDRELSNVGSEPGSHHEG